MGLPAMEHIRSQRGQGDGIWLPFSPHLHSHLKKPKSTSQGRTDRPTMTSQGRTESHEEFHKSAQKAQLNVSRAHREPKVLSQGAEKAQNSFHNGAQKAQGNFMRARKKPKAASQWRTEGDAAACAANTQSPSKTLGRSPRAHGGRSRGVRSERGRHGQRRVAELLGRPLLARLRLRLFPWLTRRRLVACGGCAPSGVAARCHRVHGPPVLACHLYQARQLQCRAHAA